MLALEHGQFSITMYSIIDTFLCYSGPQDSFPGISWELARHEDSESTSNRILGMFLDTWKVLNL